jgi:uncharacterized SAM-binding protein YcdF (DUF218 family)
MLRLKRVGHATALSLMTLGGLIILVTITPLVTAWGALLAGPWNDPRGDVLVVLGGSLLEDGTLGESSYWRAVYAARAWKDGGWTEVVLSGGGSGVPVSEAMRNFLLAQGVPATAIRTEARSRSTRENAIEAKALLGAVPTKRIVLMTSDYHMFRAQRTFARAGLVTIPRPIPDARKRAADWSARWPAFLDLVLETTKIVYYQARGWI